MKKIALVSLGCAKNLIDSEVMLGYLEHAGYAFITQIEKADIIIVNTCGFIQPARLEAEEHIGNALQVKQNKPSTQIVVAGCYPQTAEDELRQRFPGVDFWTGVNDFHHIVEILERRSYTSQDKCFLYEHDSPRLISTPSAWAYVKISEGCSHRCSFCTIPHIKGPYRSRSLESIVQEVQNLLDQGIHEINLLSQDTTFYARDLGKSEGLAELLTALCALPGKFWIRLLYAYPDEISDNLLDVMQAEKICAYLDTPFQHSHPRIIKEMNRGMAGKQALDFLDRVRKKVPDMVFRTSLIVGFPGEGQTEFEHLQEFVQAARFEHLGIFTYSPEENTPSFKLKDQAPEEAKEHRRRQLMEMQARISMELNQKWIGKQLEVLLEGRLHENPEYLVGRTRYQAPEVDGIVLVKSEDDVLSSGIFQKVEIHGSDVYDLDGTIIT